MPWSCPTCRAQVLDSNASCPKCDAAKSSWSLAPEKTRTFVVSRAKFQLLRGQVESPTPRGEPLYDPYALVEPAVARVLSRKAALGLYDSGQQPASRDVLIVRLFPKDDLGQVKLGVDFALADLRVEEFPVPEAPFVDVPFLFVAGDEPVPPEVGFPGLHVVDVSEETERGFAPDLEFSAMNRATVELPTEAAEAPPPQVLLRVEASALRCANDSGLAMPEEEREHHPLQALVRAATYLAQAPDHELLLVGHASAVGSDAHNHALSEARARGVLQLIQRDREGWVETATEHGSLRDVKAYLAYLTRERGWSCDPGPVTPDVDAAAKAGLEGFQEQYNERFAGELLVDGVCGVNTLGALFDVLQFEFERWLEKRGVGREALRLSEPPLLAAGASQSDSPRLPQPQSEEARRFVDLVLLGPQQRAELGGLSPSAVYEGELEFEELEIPAEPGGWETTEVAVTFRAPAGVEGQRFQLVSEDGAIDRVGDCDDAVAVDGLNRVVFSGIDWTKTYALRRIHGPGISTTVFSHVRFELQNGLWSPDSMRREVAQVAGPEASS